ncbi:hypothetical protein AAE478_004526 [Parahypoxylon ruwenzoriense]
MGFGDPLESMLPKDREVALKTLWISPPLWGLSSSLVKMSIVASYLRIWSGQTFVRSCHALLALLAGFGLTLFLGGVFACVPVELSWTPPSTRVNLGAGGLGSNGRALEGKCINLPLFMLTTSTLNTILDLVVLSIPFPLLLRLRIPPRQRFALTAVFSIGIVVCVASAMRLVSIAQLDETADPSVDGVDLGLWSGVENNLAIFCACLPSVRPVLKRIFPKLLSNNEDNDTSSSWGGSATEAMRGRPRRKQSQRRQQQQQQQRQEETQEQTQQIRPLRYGNGIYPIYELPSTSYSYSSSAGSSQSSTSYLSKPDPEPEVDEAYRNNQRRNKSKDGRRNGMATIQIGAKFDAYIERALPPPPPPPPTLQRPHPHPRPRPYVQRPQQQPRQQRQHERPLMYI